LAHKILVTGASGQDGYYLIELLRKEGCAVHAQSRDLPRSYQHHDAVQWHIGDPVDDEFLEKLISSVVPDEIYNFPSLSWNIPHETAELNAFVPQKICELMLRYAPHCRLFQASSSEIFGDSVSGAQDEQTPCVPKTPYGVAKLYAHRIIGAYREQYGLHACAGILFNHESPRRPLSFVSQKIAYAAAAVSLGLTDSPEMDERGQPVLSGGKMQLGDIKVRRDFGFAGDYVKAMRVVIQHPTPDDYVIGTGQDHSVEEFCDAAFEFVGRSWRDHVSFDSSLIRKVDSHYSRANSSKLRSISAWRPTVSFHELVSIMVSAQVESIKAGLAKRRSPDVASDAAF
jgi:GDPmannose 4,6-dehydratase